MGDRTVVDLDSLQRDLDELRARVTAEVGAEDAEYIRSVYRVARSLEVCGRVLIHVSLEPVSFGIGVVSLGLYKILENMEIAHNVLHGQYDFMGDAAFDSKTYEWDVVGTSKSWKHGHNVTHHTFTNVLGKDDDFGYLFFRFSPEVRWNPSHLFQPVINPIAGLFFEQAVSYYHARPSEYLSAEKGTPERKEQLRTMRRDYVAIALKTVKKYAKDYVLYPALAGPFAPKVAIGNALANGLRNVWSYAVIHCGHLTEATYTFSEEDLRGESRGGFYLRQILGSSNFEAGPLLGPLSGHLSHQIEHHLFPEVPARRYRRMAADVRRICEKHGIPYNTGTFGSQLVSVAKSLLKYSLPNPRNVADRRASKRFAVKRPAALNALTV